MLPPELQDYILLLKRNQECFEEERERKLKALGQEIVMYKKTERQMGPRPHPMCC